MNKIKRFLTLILSIILVVTSLFMLACNNSQKPADGEPEKGPSGAVTAFDFEDYDRNFTYMRSINRFGQVNVNTNADYVRSGNQSAELRPLGSYTSKAMPIIYAGLYSEKHNFNFRDFTRVKQVSAWLYNAESTALDVEVGLVTKVTSVDLSSRLAGEKFELAPGVWTEVVFNVDINIIDILYDHKKVQGVYFGFDNALSRDIADAPRVYLDDISLFYGSSQTSVGLLEFEENEICNFDKLFQKYILTVEAENPAAEPTLSVVDISKEIPDVSATTGTKVLKLVTRPGENKGTYQKFIIPEGLMKASSLPTIPVEDADKWAFSFSVFATGDSGLEFFPEFFDEGYGKCYNKVAVSPIKGRWTNIQIKLSDIIDTQKGGSEAMVTKPGFFRMAWCEYDTSFGEQTFYFDSFRLVKLAD